jgi:putative selenium metabolism hydrolase
VSEEECDGENLKHLFTERNLKPGCVIICEPSNNQIALGHKGKAQVIIKTYGVSSHSSAPEKGANAVYEMAEIIQRVEQKNAELQSQDGQRRTLALTRISSTSVSINAVPSACEIYLDRRIASGETEDAIRAEMDHLIQGKNATWEIGTLYSKSWTGIDIRYEPFHMAWKISPDHELTRACGAAYEATFDRQPADYVFWDFSTNAVTPIRMGIPVIGFGPGEWKLAHMRDENCEVSQIIAACDFYANLIQML